MLAIDTNILVRYLTNDDPVQSAKARALLTGHDIFVSTSVCLESEWVLRSAYKFPSSATIAALRTIAGLPNISIENPPLLAQALDRVETGMDFADALHLGAAAHCESLATFDRKFIAAAAGASPKVEEP
jgi:predicted nucleic-acid-binding protein